MAVLGVLAGTLVWRSISAPPSVVVPATDPAVPARPADAEQLTVRYVYDGDTLQLQARQPGAYVTSTGKVRVRLIGIDTPEVRPDLECFGLEAADRLRALAPVGSQVWVAPDRESFDRYGRHLLFVWSASGRLLNYDLVAEGYAEAIRVRPNDTLWPVLRDTAAQAKAAKRGLWGAC